MILGAVEVDGSDVLVEHVLAPAEFVRLTRGWFPHCPPNVAEHGAHQ